MFTMRLSKDESERLDRLAEHYGLNGVGVIRMLLKEKARELGVDPPGLAVAAMAAKGEPRAQAIMARRRAAMKKPSK